MEIFIASLSEHKKTGTPGSKEAEVAIIGYLGVTFGDRIIKKGMRSLIRMAELIHEYFKDLNRKVHEAAGRALVELYANVCPKNSNQIILSFMFEPLSSIMTSGIDIKAQQASSLVLYIWIQHLIETFANELLAILFPQVISLFLRFRADFPDLISAMGQLVDTVGFEPMVNDIF